MPRTRKEMEDRYAVLNATILSLIEDILKKRKDVESLEAEKLSLGRELRKKP